MDKEIVKEILLENLSFFEWMNMENLLISIDEKDMVLIRDINMDELNLCLNELIKLKMLEMRDTQGEIQYKRCENKSVMRKIKGLLK